MFFIISGVSVTAYYENNPPSTPIITGPTSGKPDIEYDFTFISTDPEGDDIYYVVNWGCCGNENHTYGPFLSGEEAEISHTWEKQGTFIIKAYAEDIYGAEGPEGTFSIKIPKNKTIQNSMLQLLQQRFQRLIIILQNIL
jgi:hypothetical protein